MLHSTSPLLLIKALQLQVHYRLSKNVLLHMYLSFQALIIDYFSRHLRQLVTPLVVDLLALTPHLLNLCRPLNQLEIVLFPLLQAKGTKHFPEEWF